MENMKLLFTDRGLLYTGLGDPLKQGVLHSDR